MSEENKPGIEIRPDGPLLVKDLQKLVTIDGEATTPKPVIALCRCGGSANKPFCDGTHAKIGFSGARETDKPLHEDRAYEGDGIVVRDNRVICCHNGTCTSTLPNAFQVGRSPWLDAKGASKEEFIELTRKCPSGALAYEVDGRTVRDFDRETQIRIEKDGPILCQGSIKLEIEDALQPPSKEHFALCRCGASKNKPYCDGSHYTVKFRDEG